MNYIYSSISSGSSKSLLFCHNALPVTEQQQTVKTVVKEDRITITFYIQGAPFY